MTSVERLRELLGISQSEMGRRLRVAQSVLSDIEAGRIGLSARLALRMADRWPAEVRAIGGVESLLRGSLRSDAVAR